MIFHVVFYLEVYEVQVTSSMRKEALYLANVH